MTTHGDGAPAYRERLSPSLWLLAAAAVLAPMAALVLVPIGMTTALVAGVLVGVAAVWLLVAGSPVVEVRNGTLHAGRAHIPVGLLGPPRERTGEDSRQARGPGLDPRSWHVIRGGIDGIVELDVIDPDDPTPVWVISTRTPDRLASAVRRAQSDARTAAASP